MLGATHTLSRLFAAPAGAFFEYRPIAETADALRRTTVPALSSEAVREVVTVWRVPRLPILDEHPLLQRPWAGPDAALRDPGCSIA